jgi:putative phosphoesterase
MIIGVISDTHDKQDTAASALEFFHQQGVALIIHCGDWKSLSTVQLFAEQAAAYTLPVKAVLGNNDLAVAEIIHYATTAPGTFEVKEGIFEFQIDTKKCAIYHGHHTPTLKELRASPRYDLLFLGHTHKPLIETVDSMTVINPGSTAFSIPRSKQWKPTVALLDTESRSTTLHTF